MKPAKHQHTIVKQMCNHIPAHLVPKLSRSFGVDKKARSFSPWSHVVSMLHVQIAHSLSLSRHICRVFDCRKIYAEMHRLKIGSIAYKSRHIGIANKIRKLG